MLNLVQLQERLKDVPMQALMQYANGANPTVPPFLALGELNRRKKMQEGAAAEQAKEMEGAPTVKEQIEQSAGLLALQGARQRQAAQQQAGIQAAMPMAAPNTTTSEPAQMAGGGFIDDIVVPRDYQSGGPIDVEALKRSMYRDTMQGDVADINKELMDAVRKQALRNAPGIPGLPVGKNLFKRTDYANGGIVAFNGTFDSFVQETTPRGDAKDRDATPEEKERMTLAELQEYNRSGKIPDRVKAQPVPAPRQASPTDVPKEAPSSAAPSGAPAAPGAAPSGIAAIPGASRDVQNAISRALGIDLSTIFKPPAERKFDEILAEEKRRQGLAGISEEFLDKREKALADIQSRRERERTEQPMDRLMEMLSGIAEARGGTFGTQGAAGAKRAIALEKEQKALRDKQDMEMEDLKFTVAAKRDAIRRGDKTAAEALEAKENEQRINIAKTQAELGLRQGELASQEKYRTTAAGTEARKVATDTETLNFNKAMTLANAEAQNIRENLRRRSESMMDKGLNEKIKANPNYIEEQAEAARNRILARFGYAGMPSSTESQAGGVTVKLPDGRTATFPDQAAADKFKKDAGI